jgi:hypothetical protein
MNMSLESKAKTSYQLCNPSTDKVESCPTRRWHGCGGDGDNDNCMTRKWVRLEDAQKIQADLAIMRSAFELLGDGNKKLFDRILEANKKLIDLLSKAQTMNYYMENKDIRYTQRAQKWLSEYDLQELKKVLDSPV